MQKTQSKAYLLDLTDDKSSSDKSSEDESVSNFGVITDTSPLNMMQKSSSGAFPRIQDDKYKSTSKLLNAKKQEKTLNTNRSNSLFD